jgi:hypothetical protein
MKGRCKTKDGYNGKCYSAKGLSVCDKWQLFQGFMEDMGAAPSCDCVLHRIDNNIGYHSGNVIWINRKSHYALHGRLQRELAASRVRSEMTSYMQLHPDYKGWEVAKMFHVGGKIVTLIKSELEAQAVAAPPIHLTSKGAK